MNFKTLQEQHKKWAEYNFGEQPAHLSLLGVIEEAGELAHAHLKMEQGIRGSREQHIADAKDAVGDTIIYLVDYCSRNGWDVDKIITDTWEEVRQRDWKKNPENGR